MTTDSNWIFAILLHIFSTSFSIMYARYLSFILKRKHKIELGSVAKIFTRFFFQN